MRQHLLVFLYLAAINAILVSCEYELSGEFYNEINKPSQSHSGEIILDTHTDSIVIFVPTDIKYSLNTFGLECNALQIEYLDKTESNLFTPVGQFRITPDFSIDEWFDLKATFYLGTGSGSIADRFKAENYVGTKTWKVKFVEFKKYDFQTGMRVNKDGFLEIFWIKPSYFPEIRSSINQTSTIHPEITKIAGDTIIFTDSVYFGGNSTKYYLQLFFNENNSIQKILQPNYPFPQVNISPIGLDSVLVSWSESPLNRYYRVYTDNGGWQRYVYTGKSNSFKAAITPCVSQIFYLETYPNDKVRYGYQTVNANYKRGEDANYYSYYSSEKEQFYIISPNNKTKIEAVDITTTAGNEYANNSPNKFPLRGNYMGSRFVGIFAGEIEVFDSELNEINKIQVADVSPSLGGQMSTNNTFGYYNYTTGIYTLLNVGDDAGWQKFTFKPSPDGEISLGYTNLSVNGNYIFWQGWTGESFIIYDISNHKNAVQIYKSSILDIYSLIVNPQKTNEIIIGRKDKIEFRSVPGFQLIRQIDLPGQGNVMVLNADSKYNSILAYCNNYFRIFKLDDLSLTLKFDGSTATSPNGARLYRNTFFFRNSKIDLKPYLSNK